MIPCSIVLLPRSTTSLININLMYEFKIIIDAPLRMQCTNCIKKNGTCIRMALQPCSKVPINEPSSERMLLYERHVSTPKKEYHVRRCIPFILTLSSKRGVVALASDRSDNVHAALQWQLPLSGSRLSLTVCQLTEAMQILRILSKPTHFNFNI